MHNYTTSMKFSTCSRFCGISNRMYQYRRWTWSQQPSAQWLAFFSSLALKPNSEVSTPVLMFLDHKKLDTRAGRTPLNEWSARRRGRYLHNTQRTQGSICDLSGIQSRDSSNRSYLRLAPWHLYWHKKHLSSIIQTVGLRTKFAFRLVGLRKDIMHS
jgi:hypothetical protein